MTIGINDLINVDRRDVTGNIGSEAAVALTGTTSNAANVIQVTSTSNPVTLNSPVGSITMVSAAGATTNTAFTVTNSFVDIGDVVVVSVRTGIDARRVDVTATAAGSFQVTTATFTGATVEAPVINFVVLKGAIV